MYKHKYRYKYIYIYIYLLFINVLCSIYLHHRPQAVARCDRDSPRATSPDPGWHRHDRVSVGQPQGNPGRKVCDM